MEARPPDSRYIEGALVLSINSVQIIDQEMWDLVDQLWAYVIDAARRLESERDLREVYTYFPDQPIKLELRRVGGGMILLSTDLGEYRRASAASELLLFQALRSSAGKFFTNMLRLVPENSDAYEEALESLKV